MAKRKPMIEGKPLMTGEGINSGSAKPPSREISVVIDVPAAGLTYEYVSRFMSGETEQERMKQAVCWLNFQVIEGNLKYKMIKDGKSWWVRDDFTTKKEPGIVSARDPRVCLLESCRKLYIPKCWSQLYCSPQCFAVINNKKYRERRKCFRVCRNCQKEFLTYFRSDKLPKLFCSRECKVNYQGDIT